MKYTNKKIKMVLYIHITNMYNVNFCYLHAYDSVLGWNRDIDWNNGWNRDRDFNNGWDRDFNNGWNPWWSD